MITIDDWGEKHCTYTTCSREYCEGEICYAGLYQCPHISELAKAWLPIVIEDLEDFKHCNKNTKHDDEYYEHLTHLESQVNEYQKLADGDIPMYAPYYRIKIR